MWYHPEDYQVHEVGWYPEVAQVQASWGKGAYTGGKGKGIAMGYANSSWGKTGGKKGSPKGLGKGKGKTVLRPVLSPR